MIKYEIVTNTYKFKIIILLKNSLNTIYHYVKFKIVI